MNKEEYMELLRKKLKRLPKENFEQAIEYFEEYFAEAGEENTAQAIEDLGSPQMAADQIVREFAIDNGNKGEAKKDVRKGISGVWIVLLAILASPVAFPVVIVVAALLFTVGVLVISLLAAFGLTGVAFALTGPVALIGAVTMMFESVPVALVCIGMALVSAAIGALIIYVSYLLVRKFLYWVVLAFGRRFAKGGKKNENE